MTKIIGEERGPEHYDKNISRYKNPASCTWVPLYEIACDLLPPNPGTVVDIACGTGGVAKILFDNGHTDYWGIDFSPGRIKIARKTVPDLKFTIADIFDVMEQFKQYNCFIILEFLEHIHRDLDIVACLPQGSTVIFSVPSFGGHDHVRFFNSEEEIKERYKSLLDFEITKLHRRTKVRKCWISRSIRK